MKIDIQDISVNLSQRGSVFHASWTDADGKRHRQSTKQTTLQAAITAAGRMIKGAGRASHDMRLSDGLELIWRESWRHEAYVIRRTYVEEAIKVLGDPRLVDMGRADLMDLREYWQDAGLSNATVNRKVQAVATIVNASCNDWDVREIGVRAPKLAEREGRYRYLTDDEISDLLRVAKDPWRLIFRILIETGMRRGELLKLETRDLSFGSSPSLTVRGSHSKSKKTRTVPLSDQLAADLKVRLKGVQGIAFPEATPATLRRAWLECRSVLGMDNDPDYVLHTLRHTCATRLLNAGVPTMTVKLWLGHASVTTTERYLNQSGQDLARFAELSGVAHLVPNRVNPENPES